jgi:hypothetical protein
MVILMADEDKLNRHIRNSNSTHIELKEYLESKLCDLEEKADLKIDSLKEATSLAKATLDERLARMNEFRESLKDQNQTFVTKNEFNVLINRIEDDIKSLRESRAELQGKASQNQVNIALLISVAGVVIGVTSMLRSLLG